MKNIIFGIIFIIGGASGQLVLRGTNSSMLLVIVGVISVVIGIVRLTSSDNSIGIDNDNDEPVAKKEPCVVSNEKLIVYNKTHENFGVLTELEIGTKFILDFGNDFNRFYPINLQNGQTGYILKTSKYSKI